MPTRDIVEVGHTRSDHGSRRHPFLSESDDGGSESLQRVPSRPKDLQAVAVCAKATRQNKYALNGERQSESEAQAALLQRVERLHDCSLCRVAILGVQITLLYGNEVSVTLLSPDVHDDCVGVGPVVRRSHAGIREHFLNELRGRATLLVPTVSAGAVLNEELRWGGLGLWCWRWC